MAIPSWPSNVEHRPAPSMWAPPVFTPPRATEMEGGNVRVRVKPGDGGDVSKWGQELTNAQFASFLAFYRSTLANGALRFTMPVCVDGLTYEARTVQIVAHSLRTVAAGGSGVVVSFDLRVFS